MSRFRKFRKFNLAAVNLIGLPGNGVVFGANFAAALCSTGCRRQRICSVCLAASRWRTVLNLQAEPVFHVGGSQHRALGTAGAVALFAHALSTPLDGKFVSLLYQQTMLRLFNRYQHRRKVYRLPARPGTATDPMSYGGLEGHCSEGLHSADQLAVFWAYCPVSCKGAVWLLRQSFLESQQNRTVLLFAVMLLAYALPAVLGGNGYLSVYLCGITLGNTSLSQKRYLVHFFDVLTDVSQVIIFFLLGLLVTPSELPELLLPALGIMLFLTLVARPAVVTVLLLPFRARWGQIGIVSWAGLRGAASIVFAISAVLSGVQTRNNLFNLVFCIVLFSIALQGSLLPKAARHFSMIDHNEDVAKTFNDYQAESDVDFIKIHLGSGHPWCGCTLREAALPPELLVTMIVRGKETIVPDGATRLQAGDLLVLAARAFEDRENISLHEINVERGDRWAGKSLAELPVPEGCLVILVKRHRR